MTEMLPDDLHASARFPRGFLWGAATSSHQVEGDNFDNDWWAWETAHPERIRGGRPSGRAAEWWRGRAEGDLALAARLGHNAHRMSLEWSRIEPQPGRISHRAIDRYRAILDRGRSLGLAMYVNIHHFTLPVWVARRGGWLAPSVVRDFAAYASTCADAFGDLVTGFLTINEPAVLAFKSYVQGAWPPGRRSPRQAARCVERQLDGHLAAHRAIKARRPDVPVGIALNLPTVSPRGPSLADRAVAGIQDWLINGAVLEALGTGRRWPPLATWPGRDRRLGGALDFIGVNYYGAYEVAWDARRGFRFCQESTVATATADWGRPSPTAFTETLVRAGRLGVPVLVAENGLYTHDDEARTRYLIDHVAAVHRAIEAGVPVRGYLHWTLIDNFEWAQGWTTPFGLVGLDLDTQERAPKRSAHVLARIAERNAIPPDVVEPAA